MSGSYGINITISNRGILHIMWIKVCKLLI